MGEFLSPIVEAGLCLWYTVANRAVYIRNLKENLYSLEVAMERLKLVYEDVKHRVEREEKLLRKRTNEVAGWLDRVRRMEAKVSEILEEGKEQEQKKCLGDCCPKNCRSTYKVGKRVPKMLNEVNELVTEGRFRAPVNEKPMEKTLGLDLMVEEVWRCIEDTDLRTIGLYGLGGVGKTTLLKKINNEFLNRSHGFEAVIWVSVSIQPALKKIQDEILREFQIHCERTVEESSVKLYRILKGKKFVLLLDDIWERIDLAELGVLNHDQDMQKGYKVVFTTRSLEICGLMEAQRKIKVECLTTEAALDLFRMKVGEDTLNSHPRISELAEIMAAECKGLPLALVTVGRAMASIKNPVEWEQAISILRNSPSQFPGETLNLNTIDENTSSMTAPGGETLVLNTINEITSSMTAPRGETLLLNTINENTSSMTAPRGETLLLNTINENTSSKKAPRVRVIKSKKEGTLKSSNRAFTHFEVVSITSNFQTIISEGGFGKVFLGTLDDDTQVAVKRWSISSRQGYNEFQAKAHMMVYHKNLVTLVGYCDEGDNKALIYEYMANGNLRQYLSEESTQILTWEERLKIALDAARGLEYLHNGCTPPIVHRDVKTSNILLNEKWEAKLADFGLSRVFPTENATHVSTDPKGTNGYLDPEYNVTKKLNKASDIYSFGVVLLELVTGQPAIIRREPYSLLIHISQWVNPLYRKRGIGSIVDPRLQEPYNYTASAERVIDIAITCVESPAAHRPNISEVCDALKESQILQTDAKRSQRKERENKF